MDDLTQRAEFRIDSVAADSQRSGHSFLVELEARAQNNVVELYHIESEVAFQFASNKTLYLNGASVPLRTDEIRSNGTGLQVRVEPTVQELERIEEYREGEGFDITLQLYLRGRHDRNDEISAGTFECDYSVTGAEWSTVLENLGYHNTRAIEIHLRASNTALRDTLATANARILRAERLHNEGDYESAVRACRDAIESIEEIQKELENLVDTQKWEKFESSMGNFKKGFVGLLCHSTDKTNAHPTLKRDSDFVLGVTKSYLRYISTAIKEEDN